MERTYKVGELNALLAESSKEFKAKLGTGVESNNKSNNDKAYKDAKKRAKDFDGGGKEGYWKGKAEYKKMDDGRTTLGYNPDSASKEYKDRINAQAKGYTSKQEMENGIEKQGDYEDNDKIRKEIEKSETEKHKKTEIAKKSGLTASKMPPETFKKEELYENNYPTAWFKKTTFLTENHMMSIIPDEFKKEGKLFNMKDKTESNYLCEWKGNKAVIVKHTNPKGMNESLLRMKELMGYKYDSNHTDKQIRECEGEERFESTLNKMRRIIS